MVDDFEKFHGVALQSLVSSFDAAVLIKKTSFSRSAYIINKSTGLYIKHARARLTPWNFSFREMDYLALRELQDRTQQIYIYLVCGFVGAVALSLDEVLEVTDFFTNPESKEAERILRQAQQKIDSRRDAITDDWMKSTLRACGLVTNKANNQTCRMC
jgi:hypothetical protein